MAVIDIPTARFVQLRPQFEFKGTPPAKFMAGCSNADPEWTRLRQFMEVEPPETHVISILDVSGMNLRAVSAIWLASHGRLDGLGICRTFEVATELPQYWQNGRLYSPRDNWWGEMKGGGINYRVNLYAYIQAGDLRDGKTSPTVVFQPFGPDNVSVKDFVLPEKSYVAVKGDARFLHA